MKRYPICCKKFMGFNIFSDSFVCMIGCSNLLLKQDWEQMRGQNPCCGTAPTFWTNGMWKCNECDKEVIYEQTQFDLSNIIVPKLPEGVKCDCGAKVAKTTCANWCSTKGGK